MNKPEPDQLEGDGQQHNYRLRFPIIIAAGIVDFLMANGVTIAAASATPQDMTLDIVVAGVINCIAAIHVAKWLTKSGERRE